jgi:short-subunit dehydrogenase
MLFARREEKLREACDEIRVAGGHAEFIAGDVANPEARRAALEACRVLFGGLDILVNNAGVGALGRFDEADATRLRQLFDVNFFAPAELIRESLPMLREGTNPIVVNIGSILGHRAVPRCSEYCATKFAMQGLSEALRAEFSTIGVDLLVVSPGTTQTEFFDHVVDRRSETRWPKQAGVPVAAVARATVRAIRAGRYEIIPNLRGRIVVWLNRLCPRLVDWLMSRYG